MKLQYRPYWVYGDKWYRVVGWYRGRMYRATGRDRAFVSYSVASHLFYSVNN